MKKYIKKGYNLKSAAPKGNRYGIGNKGFSGRKHTEKTRNLMKKSHKGMLGKKHNEYSKSKMRKSHIEFMKFGNIKTQETTIEKMIREELGKRNIKFISQFPIKSIAIVDFYIPEYNTIIQCDGNFWHYSAWAKKYGKDIKDKKQNLFFNKNGYKLFRFTETDIKKSAKKCIDKIWEDICKEK